MNKNIIIITGHGHYASGMKSFIKEVAGEIAHVEFIDFNSEISADDLLKIFQKKSEEYKNSNLLFITDITGGTPFNKAAEISVGNERIIVVSGCSPGAVLEACLTKDELSFEELAESIIENTKNNVIKFELNISDNSQEPVTPDSGI